MLRFLFIGCFLLFSSTIAWADTPEDRGKKLPYYEENYRANPCGPNGVQRDSVTAYLEIKFNAEYRDLSSTELQKFLKELQQEDSRISNIRIFRAPRKEGYAVTSSYLFQNFLSGKVLVELYCVVRINGSPIVYLREKGLNRMVGKPFEEIGLE
jgi:hypothetical protein